MSRKNAYIKLGISTFILCVILATATVIFASSGGGHGGPAGPTFWGIPTTKWWDLLWRVLNFTVLLVVLVKVLAKPIANGLRSRQQSIKDQFGDYFQLIL